MRILVASVHHTGTGFVFSHLLGGRQISHSRRSYTKGFPVGNFRARCHCEPRYSDDLAWWRGKATIIVPLRHPASVAVSWKVRDKDLSQLDEQWHILKTVVDHPSVLYLPIDSAHRNTWLEQLGRGINKPLQTDWPVISSRQQTADLTQREKQGVRDVMADGFFDRFYEDLP